MQDFLLEVSNPEGQNSREEKQRWVLEHEEKSPDTSSADTGRCPCVFRPLDAGSSAAGDCVHLAFPVGSMAGRAAASDLRPASVTCPREQRCSPAAERPPLDSSPGLEAHKLTGAALDPWGSSPLPPRWPRTPFKVCRLLVHSSSTIPSPVWSSCLQLTLHYRSFRILSRSPWV